MKNNSFIYSVDKYIYFSFLKPSSYFFILIYISKVTADLESAEITNRLISILHTYIYFFIDAFICCCI